VKKRRLVYLLVGLLLFSWLLTAQEDAQIPDFNDETTILIEDTPAGEVEMPRGATFSFWDGLRMVLVLGAVLAFIYLLFRILKKAGGPRFSNPELISLHATLGISGGKTLHLVEVGGEYYLVGASENGVNLISKIEDKDALDQIQFKVSTEKPEPPKNFADVLTRLFQKGEGGDRSAGSLSHTKEFMASQRDRLKNL
jgi:flagellar protein FliO/FliZ